GEGDEDREVGRCWGVGNGMIMTAEGRDGALRCYFEGTSLLARTVSRRAGIAHALLSMATSWRRTGEYERAREAFEGALASFQDCDDRDGIAQALHGLGNLARSTGEVDLRLARVAEGQ